MFQRLNQALLLASLAVLTTSCTDQPAAHQPEGDWQVKLVGAIGDPGLIGEATAGVLGSAMAAAATTDGVLVLDQQASRVVYFSREGELRGSVGGGGDGPGEFQLARHVTALGDSAVSVLDYGNGRVTTFSLPSLEMSGVVSGIPGRGFHHLWRGDTIWVVRPNLDGPTFPLMTGYLASSSEEVEAAPAAHAEDQVFGGAYGVGASRERIVTSTRRPGLWWERTNGQWNRVGVALFPDAPSEKRVETQPRSFRVIPSPASASHIALLGDSLVIQRYVLRPGVQDAENPDEVPRETYLGVFAVDGRHLGSIEVDNSAATCLEADSGSVIMLCAWEPYPQVRRYALVPPTS